MVFMSAIVLSVAVVYVACVEVFVAEEETLLSLTYRSEKAFLLEDDEEAGSLVFFF